MIAPFFIIKHVVGSRLSQTTRILCEALLVILGCVIIAAAAIKIWLVYKSEAPQLIVLWCFIEGCVAICVSCLPGLWLLYDKGRTSQSQLSEHNSISMDDRVSGETLTGSNKQGMGLNVREL